MARQEYCFFDFFDVCSNTHFEKGDWMKPYIGVTGFTKLVEVAAALSIFPENSERKLMVGVLATWKSLRDIPMKPRWAKQTPDPKLICDLFRSDKQVLNLVHYSTQEGQENSMVNDMIKIHEFVGHQNPNFHGFQLNLAWPDVDLFDSQYLSDYQKNAFRPCRDWLVLQIGQKAVEMAGGTPRGVADKLYHYVGTVDGILLDPSGGLGKPFDTERAREFLSEIAERGWNLGLGVAGGLGPDSLDLVEPLVSEFPDLSIDAQGRLRNAENDLDPESVKTYLTKALQMFASA